MQRRIIELIFLLAISFVIGCGQVRTRNEISRGEGPKTTHSQQSGREEVIDEPVAPPKIADTKELKVALLLGPGGYKSFAHLGVLKEFRKANIPVHKVVGFEWGALVGALYAQRGQVHELEWKLYKLEKVELGNSGFFAKSSIYNMGDMAPYLKANIENMDVTKTTIPFDTASLNVRSGVTLWARSGSLIEAVQSALPAPPLFRAHGDKMAALFSMDEAVHRLKSEGFNVIILVDVLGDGPLFDKDDRKQDDATAALWAEARRELWAVRGVVTDIISVPTKGISMRDFGSRKVLVTSGEAAGEKAVRALLSKYGF